MQTTSHDPTLFIVATPIGNLDDLSERARRVLGQVDLILAEDTRRALKLLSAFGIPRKKIISYHDHSERAKAMPLVDKILNEGLQAALISDAGTPCIADPGYHLVMAAWEKNLRVCPVAGPSALTALASSAGLPSDRILFVGFLPAKAHALAMEITSWRGLRASVVFFDSLRRLGKTLAAINEVHPNAMVCIGRELTKLHEELARMPVSQAQQWVSGHPVLKGEVVVMVDIGADITASEGPDREQILADLRLTAKRRFVAGATLKDLLLELASTELSRTELYKLLLEVKVDLS